MAVKASVGAEWIFERINGSVLDFALFWEDCSWCDSDEPPLVKNVGTLYEDEILRVTYVGGRWVVQVLWHHGGFTHWVYVNGSLFFVHDGGSAGGGPSGEFFGEVLRIDLRSSGDPAADSYAVFYAVPKECLPYMDALAFAAVVGLDKNEASRLVPSVASVSRERGVAAWSGAVCAVPLVYDVQIGYRGRLERVREIAKRLSWDGGPYIYEPPVDPQILLKWLVKNVEWEFRVYPLTYEGFVRHGPPRGADEVAWFDCTSLCDVDERLARVYKRRICGRARPE